MARQSLTEIIGGRLISDAPEIFPTVDEPVRAIDVLEPYGAVYRFSVAESGAWFEECSIALKGPDGLWTETTAGGSHGDSWDVPWRPSFDTLDGHTVSIFGSAGMELPYEDDRVVFVRGVYGFADRAVRSLHISAATGERAFELDSPVGAFVVLVLGESSVELQGLDSSGAEVGQPATAAPV
jgi:hypothetical protein